MLPKSFQNKIVYQDYYTALSNVILGLGNGTVSREEAKQTIDAANAVARLLLAEILYNRERNQIPNIPFVG